jgi:hypothetical protein
MSPETVDGTRAFREPRGVLGLWFALLGGPVAWMLGLGADYNLVRLACAKGTMLPLHLVSLATLLLAASAAAMAWRDWHRAGPEWPGEGGSVLDRSRFMAAAGLGSGTFFSLVILAQWLAKLFLDPCIGI